MADIASLFARELAEFSATVRDLPVAPAVNASQIRDHLRAYDFASPQPLDALLVDVSRMLRDWTLHSTHPRYFGLFVPGVHPAGIWADALAALYNPQVGAWWHAPAANEIERHVLRFCATSLGLPDETDAHFTSGGSEANYTALAGAVAAAFPDAAYDGIREVSDARIYLSTEAHHSFQKVARTNGLGERAICAIPVRDDFTIDVERLRRQVRADVAGGVRPLMIVATFGTTTAGAIDSLGELAHLSAQVGAWFHVDAAWGAGVAFAPRLRSLADGIERAHSVTWDAHKWLSVPMGAGMFFTSRPEVLQRLFGVDAPYLPNHSEHGPDLYVGSLQWSRRFIGLKVFMTLAALGREGLVGAIEHQIAIGDYLRDALRASGWTIVNQSPLPIVCFTHPRCESGMRRVEEVVRATVDSGIAWVSEALLAGKKVVRACVTNHGTTEGDVDLLVRELTRHVR